jgi:prepilin-type N-terminal cleavage/methylation domain-containing protein
MLVQAKGGSMHHSKTTAGFTLVEIIIVVAIIAVFVMFALPGFGRLVESNRTQAAAEDLVRQFLYAKEEAGFKQKIVTVVNSSGTPGRWDLGLQIYQSGDRTANRAFNAASNDILIRSHQGINSPSLVARGSAGVQSWVSFRPEGVLGFGGQQTIVICQDNRTELGREIVMRADGAIFISTAQPVTCAP